jgi:hypothetical protein
MGGATGVNNSGRIIGNNDGNLVPFAEEGLVQVYGINNNSLVVGNLSDDSSGFVHAAYWKWG